MFSGPKIIGPKIFLSQNFRSKQGQGGRVNAGVRVHCTLGLDMTLELVQDFFLV